jgi:RNA polymerase sigma factor (sigma-70 family)
MLDRQDIVQEIWLWFLTHQNKIDEWGQLDVKEKNKLIGKSARNAALKYCEKEKAKVIGYDVTDIFYYDRATIEIFLPSIITKDYEIPESLVVTSDNSRSTKDPAEGNGWLAMRADISRGYDKLDEKHKEILRLRYLDESRTLRQLGDSLGISEEATRKRVDRAIKSLINKIGGKRP